MFNLSLMNGGNNGIPGGADALLYSRGGVDTIGVLRTLKAPRYLSSDGTGYASHVDLTATCTIDSSGGTSTPTITTAGQVDFDAGTVWDMEITFDDGTTSVYPFGDAAAGVIWDVSGYSRHLVISATGLTAAEDATCEIGSDWLNLYGWSTAEGNQYLHPISFGLIPDDVIIPALADGSGCCAWEVLT